MVSDTIEEGGEFIWRMGRNIVSLTRVGNAWEVSCQSASRLLGPTQTVYQASHRQAKFAAWDVMARVISLTHDEEEGVQIAMQAAQWMRSREAPGSGSPSA